MTGHTDRPGTWGVYSGGRRIARIPTTIPYLIALLLVVPYYLRPSIEALVMTWRLHLKPPWLGKPRVWFVHDPRIGGVTRMVRSLSEYLIVTSCLPDDARYEVVGLPLERVYEPTPEAEAAS